MRGKIKGKACEPFTGQSQKAERWRGKVGLFFQMEL